MNRNIEDLLAALDDLPEWQQLLGIELYIHSLNNIGKASATDQVPPEEVTTSEP